MTLTDAQLETFHRDGIVMLPELFSPPEVQALRAAFDAVCGEHCEANVREKRGGAVRTAMGLHLRHPTFARLVRDARLVGPARQILATEALYVQQVKVNVKAAFEGEAWQWHYDFATHHHEDGVPQPLALNLHVFLDDVTAAIDGICLGGGLEISLACDHRVASDHAKTRMGLPEVMLGILPAWGGTTRLPRLIGLQAALDMLLTGKQVSASRARRMGLVDAVLPAPIFHDKVAEFARDLAAGKSPGSRASRGLMTRLVDDTPPGRMIALRMARKSVMQKTGGHYPAPLAILDVLSETLGDSVETALEAEARAAGELIVSTVSKNLIHVFNLREATKKTNGTDNPDATAHDVDRLGVLGAGVMGGGIAQLAAYKGVATHMKDIRHEAVQDGLKYARGIFDKAVQRKKMRRKEADDAMELISGGLTYDGSIEFLQLNGSTAEAFGYHPMDLVDEILAARPGDRMHFITSKHRHRVDRGQVAERLARKGRKPVNVWFEPA